MSRVSRVSRVSIVSRVSRVSRMSRASKVSRVNRDSRVNVQCGEGQQGVGHHGGVGIIGLHHAQHRFEECCTFRCNKSVQTV